MIKLITNTFSIDAAAPDGTAKRTITGIAVPYNVVANASGTEVMFAPGSLPTDGKAPKLFMSHDASQAIGIVTEREDDEDNMYFVARVSKTELGDEALILAADGVLDSVSVGVDPTKFTYNDDGVMIIESALWLELSLVPSPAFEGAIITKVAASSDVSSDDLCNNDSGNSGTAIETIEEIPVSTPEVIAPEVIQASAPLYATAKREPRLPGAGEYVAAMHKGGEIAAAAQRAFAEYRAYHRSPIEAAGGDNVLSNDAGIVPTPILGPVFANINYIAPLLSAVGTRAMPNGGNGATFIRPTWTTHPTVAEQTTELTAVSATTAVIAANTVTKKTFAGSAQLSYQVLDFTDPNAMDIIVQDLAGQYLTAIDDFACDALLAAATSAGVWDLSVVDLLKSIYDAATVTAAATNYLPTHIAVDPATWSLMMQLVDDDKRPIFGYTGGGLNAVNAIGQGGINAFNNANPLGLQIVVDNKFAAKTMVIFNSNAAEIYRQDRGLLTVEVPSTLGRQMSVFGYAAFFAANSNMIQKITQA